MRVVFMGTPDIAKHALEAILKAGHEVVAVYTKEDKPVGRKQVLTAPPTKQLAEEYGIPVEQPKTLRTPEQAERLAQYAPDVVAVVAYGLLLPRKILDIPKHGCVNLHVSLLPKYRGAAPIQWAVINGDALTGVSIMQMDEGMDTGAVISERSFEIAPSATAGEVFLQATEIGAQLLVQTLIDIEAGNAKATPQQGQASCAPRLEKGMAELDFEKNAQEIHNLVRGCNPWPLAWFTSGGKKIKVLCTQCEPSLSGKTGEVIALKPLTVACGCGAVVLSRVVPEGSREMQGEQWAMGRKFSVGDSVF